MLASANGKQITLAEAVALDASLKRVGHPAGLGLAIPYREFHATAALSGAVSRDISANGGNPDKPLVLGGFVFTPDPKFSRISDDILAATLDARARLIYGPERFLDANVVAQRGIGLRTGLNVEKLTHQLCSKNHVASWLYVDACTSQSHEIKELSNSTIRLNALKLENVFLMPDDQVANVSVSSQRRYAQGYKQAGWTVGGTLLGKQGYTALEYFSGKEIIGLQQTTHSLLLDHTRVLFKKRVRFSYKKSTSRGGRLLGFPYIEKTTSADIIFFATSKINLSLGYVKNKSNVDFFAYQYPTVGIGYVAAAW